MPPVAKISTPASAATNIVAATVVPAVPPRAATAARSRRDALTTPPVSRASRSNAALSSPALNRPSMIATVAGTAPLARTVSSSISAVSRFCGNGMPWVMIVNSSATTGRLSASAEAASAPISSNRAIAILENLGSAPRTPTPRRGLISLSLGAATDRQPLYPRGNLVNKLLSLEFRGVASRWTKRRPNTSKPCRRA